MRKVDLTKAFAVASAFYLTAACGSSVVPGTPEQTNQTDPAVTSTAAKLPSDGAPRVQDPVQTTQFESAPCSLLTSEQRQQLGFEEPGKRNSEPAGPSCKWSNSGGISVFATFVKKLGGDRGLSAIYAARKNYQDFEPVPDIEGFPAVIANGLTSSRTRGDCAIELGFSDTQVLDIGTLIDFNTPNYSNACSVAKEVAKAFAATARHGGS